MSFSNPLSESSILQRSLSTPITGPKSYQPALGQRQTANFPQSYTSINEAQREYPILGTSTTSDNPAHIIRCPSPIYDHEWCRGLLSHNVYLPSVMHKVLDHDRCSKRRKFVTLSKSTESRSAISVTSSIPPPISLREPLSSTSISTTPTATSVATLRRPKLTLQIPPTDASGPSDSTGPESDWGNESSTTLRDSVSVTVLEKDTEDDKEAGIKRERIKKRREKSGCFDCFWKWLVNETCLGASEEYWEKRQVNNEFDRAWHRGGYIL